MEFSGRRLAVAVVVTDWEAEVDEEEEFPAELAVMEGDGGGCRAVTGALLLFACSERLLLLEAASWDIRRTPDCLLDWGN